MSGGSYNYVYSQVKEACEGAMYDDEMNDMIIDLCEVLHDVEWWQSGDIGESEYRDTVQKFKEKWFRGDRKERYKSYIDAQVGLIREQLYRLIGVEDK